MFEVVWLIPFAPLLGFVVNGVAGRRIPRATGWISTGAILGSFVLTVALWIGGITADQPGWTFYPWVDSGTFAVNIGFLLDPLAIVMLLVVTGVSALVALYSVGYMDHDAAKSRFHTWIPLFVFSMVMLVMSDNLLQLFIFWEMVGLCSYLLIGYWHDRHSANIAATKAFLVNRIGDFGFIIGIVLAFFHFDTLRYREIFEVIGDKDPAMTTAIAFLLFVGAMGKSAQFPLHVWLPDAMEGPTPVSALIHAATMVTAGVYIVARMNPLYTVSPEALIFVAAIGTVTAFVAATIALVQTDIKRVLAYSTVSQLGLMFVALGAGAYSIAIFHLATHAFFKALLFLGSGSVIHALNDEQDMRQMGGLWRKMPLTYGTFLLGGLALAAVFPLAGFWSKDEILASAFLKATAPAGASLAADHGAGIFWLFFIVGLVVSLMTAFYTLRMILMTFHGKPRNQELHDHAHESPWVMTLPLGILAIGAVVAGAALGIPPEHGFLHEYLYKTAGIIHFEGAGDPPTVALAVISTVVALAGVAIAYLAYRRGVPIPDAARRLAPGAEKLFQRKWYMDHLGDGLMVMLTRAIAVVSWGFDAGVIDGLVNASGTVTRRLSGEVQRLQTGQAQNYALLMVVGIVLVIGGLMIFGGNAS
ncbi:MAG: NADH-quinone oxidoreductase subunit L [Chloroflexi bacterium]|nr:NADH-quinone oxidoreductase subunit L [Chloroflexota bacterium]